MSDKFYVRVWLNELRVYLNIDNLTLPEAQFKMAEQKRKGRKAEIFKHKK